MPDLEKMQIHRNLPVDMRDISRLALYLETQVCVVVPTRRFADIHPANVEVY
jgi:hypothetical protein